VTTNLDELIARLEALLEKMDALEEPVRGEVFELLDGFDAVHRAALARLAAKLDAETIARLRGDRALAWLLDAYSVGVDEKATAEEALESIRPYIHSHAGRVEVLDAKDGVVRLRLAGACSGCTASAITLREGIEQALREGFPGFLRIDVEEDDAEPHPPPGPTLLQIGRFESG
jgi:Fe-S cluster biogenesis protein NfuA